VRTQAYGCKLNEGRVAGRGLGFDRVPDAVCQSVKVTPSMARGGYDIACQAVYSG